MFDVASEAKIIMDMLEDNGFEAFLVGGCVRDYILKRSFNDFDITTNALPEDIKRVFNGFKVIDTGVKHGTVTVLVSGIPIEVTTYRIDGEYTDNRRPESVSFSKSLEDDLCRRDFTINALAYNGVLVDLYGGIRDLNNKIIRCVGDPDKRFNEDGLRILRALRFSSVLGFQIEKETSDSIIKNKLLLKNISAERLYTELTKLLSGSSAGCVIKKFGEVFEVLFKGKFFGKRAQALDRCPPEVAIRLACFFLCDEYYRDDILYLKPGSKTYTRVCSSIDNYELLMAADKVFLKKYLKKYGSQIFFDVLALKYAEGNCVDGIKEVYYKIIDNNECYTLNQLEINGRDLIELGLRGGKIGALLDEVLNNVIEGVLRNDRDELLLFVKGRI